VKVLFLTKYPVEGASSRYRVYQYVPELERLGIECTVSSLLDSELYRISFARGNTLRKAWGLLRASLKRLWLLRRWSHYDVIYMQRELFSFGPPWVERWLRHRGARLIFDYDDALFIHKPGKFNPALSRLRRSERIYELFSLVDCVVAGNDYLAEVARDHCPDCRILHVAEDTARFGYENERPETSQVVVGWLGSATTEKYLQLIASALQHVCRLRPQVTLRVVGGGEFALPGVTVEHLEWSLEAEVELLSGFDIGIMPLPLEDWSRGKSGGKARTYMAAGIPPVCTAIGYNCELVEDGRTGLLVKSGQEWESALLRLVDDPALRRDIGRNAQHTVARDFSVTGQAGKLAGILRDVVAGGEDS
jgi:glycosyltransferase involved in cell wall biosynthesis